MTETGTHKAPSIKVAEASKVIENAQRDLNISFGNELALIFERIGIDSGAVIFDIKEILPRKIVDRRL